MKLVFRPAAKADFTGFYEACFCYDLDNRPLRTQIEREYHVFINSAPRLSMIVEDKDRAAPHQTVGLAQTVFVTDAYVAFIKTGQHLYANLHAAQRLPDGSWPLLDQEAVRKANTTGGLNALTTWYRVRGTLPPAEQLQIREFMYQTYPLFYWGYLYKELLAEVLTLEMCETMVRAGYRCVTDYAPYFERNLCTLRLPPYLMGVTRADALIQEGSLASRLFAYTPPRFQFKPHEQELLLEALMGRGDEELADRLGVSLEAVKKRWAGIFAHVEEIDAELLPEKGKAGRGVERRAPLLNYLRCHLEELRPVAAKPRRARRG